MPAGRIGRARCKECRTLVEAEVETKIECLGCGREFKIPDEPQYTATKSPLANHSISVLAQRVRIETHSLMQEIQALQEESREMVKPYVRPKNIKRTPRWSISISSPEEQEPEIIEVIEEENKTGAWVIIELPGHESLKDIKYSKEGNTLSIESMKFPFKKEIFIPDGEMENINLRNGIFSFFDRKEKEKK